MARKSRKNVMLQENTALPDKEKKVLFKAGLYARLSHEKEENIERGTIETQMELMKNYVKDHEDIVIEAKLDKIDGLTFIEQIMKPHTPYYKSIKGLFDKEVIHGMAHITGGGIEGNLCRIIPEGLCAKIDLSKLNVLSIFKYIRNSGNISDEEMLRTFNCGVGFNMVVAQKDKNMVMRHINQFYNCYEIGLIEEGVRKVVFENRINWL